MSKYETALQKKDDSEAFDTFKTTRRRRRRGGDDNSRRKMIREL